MRKKEARVGKRGYLGILSNIIYNIYRFLKVKFKFKVTKINLSILEN